MSKPDVLVSRVVSENGVEQTILTVPVGSNGTKDFNVKTRESTKNTEDRGKTPTPKRHTLGSVGGDPWEDFE